MKKTLLVCLFLAFLANVNAQQKTLDSTAIAIQKNAEAMGQGGNNEIKLNLLLAVIGMPEITYERILADNMAVGLSVFAGLGEDADPYKFGAIPHFRVYFGSKKAAGFFIEANAAVMSVKEDDRYVITSVNPYIFSQLPSANVTNFGLGAAAGGKFLTRNGFLGEAYLGVGRFFGDNKVVDAYPRIGITIGKRF